MSEIPSGPLAGAAVSASALAGVVLGLVQGLPIAADVSVTVASTCGRIRAVTAPRARTLADVATIAGALVTAVQATARAAEPADASAGLYAAAAAARVAVPVSASPVLTRHYALARALSAAVEAACLGEAFVAEARSEFSDRRAASEARDRIGATLDAARDRIAAALGQDGLALLATAARESAGHLVRLATSLQPVVRVDAGRSYPSTALAWSIFGDPARADEIVARNRIGTPLFCPATFEVVSPAPEA